MTTKEQLVKLVIGNDFITSPKLKKLYMTLLDRLEAETEQCNIANVSVMFVCPNGCDKGYIELSNGYKECKECAYIEQTN